MDNEPIGIAKRDIKAGEVIAEVNGFTGEVTSDNLEFVEGGRMRLLEMIYSGFPPAKVKGIKRNISGSIVVMIKKEANP